MEKNRSLAYNYAFEALPLLFHSDTSGFMRYLEKDGVEFLKFWWHHVGDQLEESRRVSPAGLSVSIDQYDNNTKIVLIKCPTPQEDGDPIFLAGVARPEKRFSLIRLPNTAFYVLSRYDDCKSQYKTAFGELTPRAIYHEIGIGLNPNKAEFKKIVITKIQKRRGTERKK
jgi:hypothetical protein